MLDATELSLRILAEMEEFQHEHVPTLMNTLLETFDRGAALPMMQSALQVLVDNGYVCVVDAYKWSAGERTSSSTASAAVIDAFSGLIVFDQSRNCWIESRSHSPTFPPDYDQIELTALGLKRARELLNERGYRWWEQRNDDEPGQ